MNEPDYYDSQASAAAALGLDIWTIRKVKREGCPAFRSGRVYRAPLLEWLRERGDRSAVSVPKAADGSLDAEIWDDRRPQLFELLETVHSGYACGAFDLVAYNEKGSAMVELIIQAGRLLDAGIDEDGYRQTWKEIFARACLKKNAENQRKQAQP